MTTAFQPWLDLARAAAPQWGLDAVEVIETGWDSRVLRVVLASGEPWIFRFPRRAEVLADLARERILLEALRDRLPVAVPNWRIHTVVDAQLVIGYPELPGVPAGDEPRGDGDFEFRIAVPPPAVFATDLGEVLAALHRLHPPGLRVVTAEDLRRDVEESLRGAGDLPVPVPLLHYWRAWVQDDAQWTFPPTMTHGDVHPGHTMVDATGALVGLIDWTDSGWGDPATDFIDTRHAFGPAFGADLLAAYAGSGGRSAGLIDRIIVRQSFAVLNTARFGSEQRRPELTARALERMDAQAARIRSGRLPV